MVKVENKVKKPKKRCPHGKRKILLQCMWCKRIVQVSIMWAKNRRYKGHCLRCFVHLFPDEPNSRNYKTKETTVVTNLRKAFLNKTWVCDKRIEGGCSQRRPGLFLDMGSHIVIVEVDENEHNEYDCTCKNR